MTLFEGGAASPVPPVCSWQPAELRPDMTAMQAVQLIAGYCPICRHAAAVHAGAGCPVCALQVALSELALFGARMSTVLAQMSAPQPGPQWLGQHLPWPGPEEPEEHRS
jgi:hypothetical protein